MNNISLALHGGAGTISRNSMLPEKEMQYRSALSLALNTGYKMLENKETALSVVEAVVCILEDSPLFNAGKGSVFTNTGKHEMDASIMDGKNLEAGAVAGVYGIKNPVSLARMVMEKSGHIMLVGEGAVEFAKLQGISMMDDAYFYNELRFQQLQEAKKNNTTLLDHTPLDEKKFGTVGAVACDAIGNLAAATSTGGMTNKKYGRVGDSPIIGSGNYANNKTCAISCTGSGEYFMRAVVAYDVSCLMEYKGLSLEAAANMVIHEHLAKINGDGGLIAVDAAGNISMPFNTEGMYRAAKNNQGIDLVEIYKLIVD